MARAPVQQRSFSPLQARAALDWKGIMQAQQQKRAQQLSEDLATEMAAAPGTSLQSLMQSPKFAELQSIAPQAATNIQTLANTRNLQRLSNLGAGAYFMKEQLKGIKDPKEKERVLKEQIQNRKSILPQFGFSTEDTEELEKILDEQGLDAALDQIDQTLTTSQSLGFALPKPTTPDIKSTFRGKAVSPHLEGKEEIFGLTPKGPIPLGIEAPKKGAGVNVYGGSSISQTLFEDLIEEKRQTQETLNDILRIRNKVEKLGPVAMGKIGKSGKWSTALVETVTAMGNFAENLGMGADVDNPDERVKTLLGDTGIGQAARIYPEFNSMLTNLAYVIAKQNDPGGRISGPDFDAALKQIAAQSDDPRVLTKVITNLGNKFLTDYERGIKDYEMMPDANEQAANVLKRSDVFDAWKKRDEQEGAPSEGLPDAQTLMQQMNKMDANESMTIGPFQVTRQDIMDEALNSGKTTEQIIQDVIDLAKQAQQQQQRGQ